MLLKYDFASAACFTKLRNVWTGTQHVNGGRYCQFSKLISIHGVCKEMWTHKALCSAPTVMGDISPEKMLSKGIYTDI